MVAYGSFTFRKSKGILLETYFLAVYDVDAVRQ